MASSGNVCRISLWGTFRLHLPDGKRLALSSRKGMALLAMLATAPDGERTRGWLQDRLWGSRARPQAQQSLRRELSRLREALDFPDGCLIDSDSERVWIDLARCEIDHGDRDLGAAFLEGFDIPGEEGFEDWLRDQRQRYPAPAPRAAPAFRDLPRAVIDVDQPTPGFGGRPAIAIIPLTDETGDPDNQFRAEGVTEELVQRLSRLRWLPVIAASTMTEVATPDQTSSVIGRLVGAGFVLRGRIAINHDKPMLHLNLVETDRGQILWSERFELIPDGGTGLLDELIGQIVAILTSRIETEQQVRVLDRPIESLDPHEMVWRARWHMRRFTSRDASIARDLLEQAIERFPNSAEVLTQFAWALAWDTWSQRGSSNDISAFRTIAMRARDADPFDGRAYMLLGMADLWMRRFDTAGQLFEEAVRLNPSLVNAWGNLGSYHYLSGQPEQAFEPLRTALDKHQVVRFAYLKPGELESRVRTVIPLALVQHQGRWHLAAEETGTGAQRTFLLRRIVGQVAATGENFEPRADDESARALRELEEVWSSHTAVVEVELESDAATRLLKRRGTVAAPSGALELHYSDLNIIADELAAFGPEVLVLSPVELRDAVRSRLELTAHDHREHTSD